MRLALHTLAHNVHLLLVSFVVLMLGLGLLSGATPVNTPAPEMQEARSAPEASTASPEATPEQASGTAVSTSKTPSWSPYEGQNPAHPSISTSTPLVPIKPAPVAPPAVVTCTPCATVTGCADACPAPVEPVPPDPVKPIAPLPPTDGSCGPCGTYLGPRPQHIMCPMNCAVLTE